MKKKHSTLGETGAAFARGAKTFSCCVEGKGNEQHVLFPVVLSRDSCCITTRHRQHRAGHRQVALPCLACVASPTPSLRSLLFAKHTQRFSRPRLFLPSLLRQAAPHFQPHGHTPPWSCSMPKASRSLTSARYVFIIPLFPPPPPLLPPSSPID